MTRLALPLCIVTLALACDRAPKEVPALSGGERIVYTAQTKDGYYELDLTIEKKGSGYRLVSTRTDQPAEELDLALGTKHGIRMAMINTLWLPPSKRAVGTELPFGKVVGERNYGSWQAITVETEGGASRRYFHPTTGFLVGVHIVQLGHQLVLKETTIPGIR